MKEISNEEVLEIINKDIKDAEKARDEMTEKYLDLSIQSLTQMRQWAFAVVTLSSAIMAFSLANMTDIENLLNQALSWAAILIFAFNIGFALYKLKQRIEGDVNKLPEEATYLREKINKAIEVRRRFLVERTEESFKDLNSALKEGSEELKKRIAKPLKPTREYDVVLGLFIVGMICLLLSRINYPYLMHLIWQLSQFIKNAIWS